MALFSPRESRQRCTDFPSPQAGGGALVFRLENSHTLRRKLARSSSPRGRAESRARCPRLLPARRIASGERCARQEGEDRLGEFLGRRKAALRDGLRKIAEEAFHQIEPRGRTWRKCMWKRGFFFRQSLTGACLSAGHWKDTRTLTNAIETHHTSATVSHHASPAGPFEKLTAASVAS